MERQPNSKENGSKSTTKTITFDGLTSSKQSDVTFNIKAAPKDQAQLQNFLSNACEKTRLLAKKHELFEAQKTLEEKKSQFARNEDAFRLREDALRTKDLQLQKSLIKFNKFLQENESKRNRAMKRASDEKRQFEGKRLEAQKLNKILDQKLQEKNTLTSKLEKNMRYQHFLVAVLDYVRQEALSFSSSSSSSSSSATAPSDDFLEIQDILNRHHILESTNKELLQRQTKNMEEYELKKSKYVQFLKETSVDAVLSQNNEIAILQNGLDMATSNTASLQGLVDSDIGTVSDRTLELGQIMASIEFLVERFENIGNKLRVSKVKGNDDNQGFKWNLVSDNAGESPELKGQRALDALERISEYIADYSGIADEWQMLNTFND